MRGAVVGVGCAPACRQQANEQECGGELHNLRANQDAGRLSRIRPLGAPTASLESGMPYRRVGLDLDVRETRTSDRARTIEKEAVKMV
jgi:hypothetical protein